VGSELDSREGSLPPRGGGGGGGASGGGGGGSARGHSRAERLEMMSRLLTPREGGSGEGGAAQAGGDAEGRVGIGVPRYLIRV